MTYQTSLFDKDPNEITNVSKIPQRSPFRYPGGKTWLVPKVRRWLNSLNDKPKYLLEPFCGGSIIGLTAAFENLTDKVILVELDDQVSSVWETILNGNAEELAKSIRSFDLTIKNVNAVLTATPSNTQEKAFQTLLKNRISHGGILAPGAGLIKNGESGKGLSSRWYPETLYKRILDIFAIKDKFIFFKGDGIQKINEFAKYDNIAAFIDPPYTVGGKKAGSRLYTHYSLDHEKLFFEVHNFNGDFLMTYDVADEVKKLAESYNLQYKEISMQNTHLTKMKELLIGRDLSWID
jgi:DNA adenine methylase